MKGYIYIWFIAIILFLLPFKLHASMEQSSKETIKSTILSGEITMIDDENISVKVFLDPNGQAVNAVGLVLNFSTSTIVGREANLEESFCKLIISNIIDNKNGQTQILCGIPNPGTTERSLIAEYVFRFDGAYENMINIDESSQVLANDGKGSDIIKIIDKLI